MYYTPKATTSIVKIISHYVVVNFTMEVKQTS